MKIVADESVDFAIIEKLRENGIEVIAIVEDFQSITDDEVLEVAVKNNSLLLTEDKRFWRTCDKVTNETQGCIAVKIKWGRIRKENIPRF